jgi:phosphoserine phosphatase
MITVIIPALNEEGTIATVVQLALQSANVTEVIVVDDKSMDNTIEEARKAGASIITSTRLGKGASMKDGVLVAKNEIITFLDADITTYPVNIIALLTDPIIRKHTDFVKSCFSRQAGRVTELVAKPLLSILYPDFPAFWQPLSGMIAGKKSLFQKIDFEEGYGVDIGILIDMFHLGVKIEEVSIGHVENKMQSLEQLGKMSKEVATTIIKKSQQAPTPGLGTFENIQVIREQMDFAIRESLLSLKKIAVFDLDNTILRTSFARVAATTFDFPADPGQGGLKNGKDFMRTKVVARMLKGRNIGDLIALADTIEVTPHLEEIVVLLKNQGYVTGIVSEGFDCVTNHLKNKFGFDFSISNELEFSRSVATGEVRIPSWFLADKNSRCHHDFCKLNGLIAVCEKYKVGLKNVLFIGDGENDICCIKKAGLGVSFCSSSYKVDLAADVVIKEPDFNELLSLIG